MGNPQADRVRGPINIARVVFHDPQDASINAPKREDKRLPQQSGWGIAILSEQDYHAR